MGVNNAPIYSAKGDIQFAAAGLTTSNANYDGTGTVSLVCTAGSDGNFIQRMRFKASGSTTAAVGRIFINNGSNVAVGTNNFLYDEVTLPTITLSTTAATTTIEVPMNFVLPYPQKIYASISVSQPAGGGWVVGTIGGSYTV